MRHRDRRDRRRRDRRLTIQRQKFQRALHLPALGERIGDALHQIAKWRYAFSILVRDGPDDLCDFHLFRPRFRLVYLGERVPRTRKSQVHMNTEIGVDTDQVRVERRMVELGER